MTKLSIAQEADLHVRSADAYAAEVAWNNTLHHQHLHRHHAGYRFLLSRQQRQRGMSHYGSAERLRAALARAISSEWQLISCSGRWFEGLIMQLLSPDLFKQQSINRLSM